MSSDTILETIEAICGNQAVLSVSDLFANEPSSAFTAYQPEKPRKNETAEEREMRRQREFFKKMGRTQDNFDFKYDIRSDTSSMDDFDRKFFLEMDSTLTKDEKIAKLKEEIALRQRIRESRSPQRREERLQNFSKRKGDESVNDTPREWWSVDFLNPQHDLDVGCSSGLIDVLPKDALVFQNDFTKVIDVTKTITPQLREERLQNYNKRHQKELTPLEVEQAKREENALRGRLRRLEESDDQREVRLVNSRKRERQKRDRETFEEYEKRLERSRLRTRLRRQQETDEERQIRLEKGRKRMAEARAKNREKKLNGGESRTGQYFNNVTVSAFHEVKPETNDVNSMIAAPNMLSYQTLFHSQDEPKSMICMTCSLLRPADYFRKGLQRCCICETYATE